ncbi:MAG TPA: hypothetical protein VKC61_11330 [Pyrinomonadaceae bacterium]|nr:hypothetical protein [Pyrinomonadaceae bacterium]
MKKRFGGALIALAFVFGIIATASTTVDAQWTNRSYGGYNTQQVQQGLQYGVNTGASDAQRRQAYSPQRSRYYRDAPTQAFRDGFVRGYDQGYRQYAGNYGYGNGGYRNEETYGYGAYGNYGGYRNGNYEQQELNSGYQQGLNTGADDGRQNKSYSPERSRYYQRASSQVFREGFIRGYDAGYRQTARNRNYRRSSTAAAILGQIFGIN